MPATESTGARPSQPTIPSPDPSSVSMSDLLASCAAASAVSTPPTGSGADEDDEAA
ncbi:hypothetical protein GCM10011583_26520 [Streptomyces camponoticapitis]|uniref:Uncharacterized protein n=1 Tax=Streptomyces camponoticapitis TaxID=1616125 RepID=A0ABQ2E3S3_9ACTN|nr:hypothetical protein [Streptomyces camponoticapitis]GGJ93733.1 hypothetical protein GCM10011583_26520 [Streptomyces camponoticapitis]